jgi:hypothetical protein
MRPAIIFLSKSVDPAGVEYHPPEGTCDQNLYLSVDPAGVEPAIKRFILLYLKLHLIFYFLRNIFKPTV